MGDGVVVLFGYPHAHEDDAERAVRSGLALVDAISRVKQRTASNCVLASPRGVVYWTRVALSRGMSWGDTEPCGKTASHRRAECQS